MPAFAQALIDAGWRLHQELVWVKDVFVLGHSDYHYQHEPIFYGYGPGAGRPGRGDHEGTRWHGDHSQSSVLPFDRPKRSEEHPTMKPVELVAYCLGNSSAVGEAVLDPFVGSGTTIIAAEQLGRRCYAMEIDPRYVAVTIKRWEAFTGRKAVQL
jgi:DNA modification methylase